MVQCTAIAASTGKRCKKLSIKDEKYCSQHLHITKRKSKNDKSTKRPKKIDKKVPKIKELSPKEKEVMEIVKQKKVVPELVEDVLRYIMINASVEDMKDMCSVNRMAYKICQDKQFWKQKLLLLNIKVSEKNIPSNWKVFQKIVERNTLGNYLFFLVPFSGLKKVISDKISSYCKKYKFDELIIIPRTEKKKRFYVYPTNIYHKERLLYLANDLVKARDQNKLSDDRLRKLVSFNIDSASGVEFEISLNTMSKIIEISSSRETVGYLTTKDGNHKIYTG